MKPIVVCIVLIMVAHHAVAQIDTTNKNIVVKYYLYKKCRNRTSKPYRKPVEIFNFINISKIEILFHYLISAAFCTFFFLLYPNFNGAIKNKYILALVFGLIIWIVSTFIILPLSNIPDIKGVAKYPNQLNLTAAIISFAGLSLCLGLPISLIANKYYRKNAVALDAPQSNK